MNAKPRDKRPSILHVCGGDPMQSGVHVMITGYSPRMWRLKQQSFCTIDYL
ncbi:hypothetical protein HYQ59_1075 [Lactobacillus crispatus]|nr:hypothetical protein [Lactobacillus crispatus]